MSKKVDFFKASKALSDRVAEYMTVQVWNATLKTRMKRDTEAIEAKIEDAPRLLAGSVFEAQLDTLVEGYKAELESVKAKYAELQEKADKFVYTDGDKKLYKAIVSGDGVKTALVEWAAGYGLSIEDTDFLGVLTVSVLGVRPANAKTIITSGATQFTQDRTRNEILKVVYGTFAEAMLKVGTLKPKQLEKDVVEYYAKKAKSRKK